VSAVAAEIRHPEGDGVVTVLVFAVVHLVAKQFHPLSESTVLGIRSVDPRMQPTPSMLVLTRYLEGETAELSELCQMPCDPGLVPFAS
jgi:hypothetical protein